MRLASGALPLAWGVLLSPLLLTACVLSLLLLPPLFTLILGGYYLLTTAYSFALKRKPVVDVLVLAALYIDSGPAQQLYATPQALWLVCPRLLHWISRLWCKTHRGEMHDDPVVFALRDRLSLLIGTLTVGIVVLATIWFGP